MISNFFLIFFENKKLRKNSSKISLESISKPRSSIFKWVKKFVAHKKKKSLNPALKSISSQKVSM